VRRNLLGLIALGMLSLAVAAFFYPPFAKYEGAGALGLRVGCVLGVVWLSWPDLHRLPPWTWYVLPIGAIVLIYARGVVTFLLPALVAATLAYVLYRKVWGSK
jgi:hypothetical protein